MLERTLIVTALYLAVSVSPALAATTTLDELLKPSPVSAAGDTVVWSRYDATAMSYQPVVSVAGRQSVLNVRSTEPFDLDVGPAGGGSGVRAIRSRCRAPSAAPGRRGCDLFLFDLTTGAEEALPAASTPGADEIMPAIYGQRIAWVRLAPGKPPAVYVRRLGASGAATRLDAVPTRECRRGRCRVVSGQTVRDLDIGAEYVAVGLHWKSGSDRVEAARIVTFANKATTVLRETNGGLTALYLAGVAIASRSVYIGVGCFITAEGCPGRSGVFRFNPATRRFSLAKPPRHLIAFTLAGNRASYLVGQDDETCEGNPPEPQNRCRLVSDDGLVFRTARRPV